MSTPNRQSLADIFGDNRDELAKAFAEATPSPDFQPLPAGVYRCLATGGELGKSPTSHKASYTVTFSVADGEHKNRKLWCQLWLTKPAMSMTRRDLAKLGITSIDMLEKPLPRGIVANVRVSVNTDDDGTTRNRVKGFDVIEVLADPTADEAFGGAA